MKVLALRSTRHPLSNHPNEPLGTDGARSAKGSPESEGHGRVRPQTQETPWSIPCSRIRIQAGVGTKQDGVVAVEGRELFGTSKRSVRGAGFQGVLAAEGRIAPWDLAPRADLTRSWSPAEVPEPKPQGPAGRSPDASTPTPLRPCLSRAKLPKMPEKETLPTTERLLDLVESMAGQPILMLVDLVADRFISGSPKRISREAPVLILSYEGETFSPGGGANAVANVAALGGVPLPLGVVGRDTNGEQLLSTLQGGA